jgi:hypothetical protein
MGLLDKVTQKQADPNQLTVEELEFILIKIKKMRFTGEELDILTRAVVKLQNQYITLGGS